MNLFAARCHKQVFKPMGQPFMPSHPLQLSSSSTWATCPFQFASFADKHSITNADEPLLTTCSRKRNCFNSDKSQYVCQWSFILNIFHKSLLTKVFFYVSFGHGQRKNVKFPTLETLHGSFMSESCLTAR